MGTRNIVLTDYQSALIDHLVERGRYQNASEVLRAGLRLLEADEAAWVSIREGLEEAVEQSRRGEFAEGDGEEAIRRVFATRGIVE